MGRFSSITEDCIKQPIDELTDCEFEFIKHCCKKLVGYKNQEEYIGSAWIGYREAKLKWNNKRGSSFKTYAFIKIRSSILDTIRQERGKGRIQDRRRKEFFRLTDQEGVSPGMAFEMISRDFRRHDLKYNFLCSIQAPLNPKIIFSDDFSWTPKDYNYIHQLKKQLRIMPDLGFEDNDLRKTLLDIFKKATRSERNVEILCLYFFEQLTLNQIAKKFGFTSSRARQILVFSPITQDDTSTGI